jgi:hypothetical protein
MPLDRTVVKAQRAVPPMKPLENGVDRFIHEQNLAHYRRLLTEASVMVDEARHRLLLKLLADEEAKDRLPLAERRIDPPL